MESETVLIKQKEMTNYEEFKKASITRTIIGLASMGVHLTEQQQEDYEIMLGAELDRAKVYSNLGGPRLSKNKYKLVANESTIIGYHPIDGRWRHITQVISKDNTTLYYTDGVRQNVES